MWYTCLGQPVSTVHRAHLLHVARAALGAAQESVGVGRGALGHKVNHWVEDFLHSNLCIVQTSTTIWAEKKHEALSKLLLHFTLPLFHSAPVTPSS